ncbi:MAG TPA: O-antigen ligase family protein [Nocardioides sp.]|nr:O-antigen ligase family protein [Nocardioides sp.]
MTGTTARGAGVGGAEPNLRLERNVVSGAVILVAVLLAAAAALGGAMALVAVGVAAYVLVLTALGRERTATLMLIAAFAMAPAYKGLASSPGATVTPTDAALALGLLMLVPSMFEKRLRLPLTYVIGLVLVIVMGLIGTMVAKSPFYSAYQMLQWLAMLVVLTFGIALWSPSWRVVRVLMWSYVVGQTASLVKAFISGPTGGDGRYMGLSHHPNAFAEGGMMAFAGLLYLFHTTKSVRTRLLILVLAAGAVESVVLSGSRATLVVIAALMLMVPFVERSALIGFAGAIVGALVVFTLPLLTNASGQGSALNRLAGDKTASAADSQRTAQLKEGWHLFLHHPVLGNGFDQVNGFHNLFLEVAAASGVVGLLGYLLILYCLCRPIFGRFPERRLAYVAWAFVGLTGTVPGMEDRTLWMPMALVFLMAAREYQVLTGTTDDDGAEVARRGPSSAVPVAGPR